MRIRPALPGGAALLLAAAAAWTAGAQAALPAAPATGRPGHGPTVPPTQMALAQPAASAAAPASPAAAAPAQAAAPPSEAATPGPSLAPSGPGPATAAPSATAAPPDGDAPGGAEVLPLPPVSPRLGEGRDYEHCMDMMASDPSGALDFAEAWEATGGGEGAQHCHAMAAIELGDPATGAAMLDRLAQDSAAPALTRAAVFGQADSAWMMAGDAARAYASATLAATLSPEDPDLLIERAVAGAALGRFPEVVDDLTRALDIDPRRADALVYRAAARRHLERLDLAADDIDRAFALDPDSPEALLERGILRQRTGDLRGARGDWQRAAELAPDSGTGDLAQQNLALLEAGPPAR